MELKRRIHTGTESVPEEVVRDSLPNAEVHCPETNLGEVQTLSSAEDHTAGGVNCDWEVNQVRMEGEKNSAGVESPWVPRIQGRIQGRQGKEESWGK